MRSREQFRTRTLRRAKNRGFTAIEVMLALTLLAIGTSGVIAMEQASIDGNYDARRLDVANSIMRLWIERLRSDGTRWTMPNPENPLTDNRATAAPLLQNVDADPTTATWHLPTAGQSYTVPWMPAFDLLGNDITVANPGTPMFCVHTRLSWLVTNELMRAEVRVFWPKGTQEMSDCASEPASDWDTQPATIAKYHFIYGVTAIRKNPSP